MSTLTVGSKVYSATDPIQAEAVSTKSDPEATAPQQPENPGANLESQANTDFASKQHAEERRNQNDLQSILLQSSLYKQAGTNSKSPAQQAKGSTTAETPLNHAKVARWQRGYLYDFGRPVSKEQAAKFIFEDGKIPDKAKLVEGPGKTWHVQMPQGLSDQIEVVKKMKHNIMENSHEQINSKQITWVDGPPLAPVVEPRRDLNNNLGFKVTKHYNLDPGQYTTGQLGAIDGKGHGHELQFDKPMTKDEVMQTLYEKNNMPNKGDVKLEPAGKEPSRTWQVKVMGTGQTRLKSAVFAAFSDSNTQAAKSAPPGVPDGVRAHLENKTIPSDAVAHPKGAKHPPGAYVWEEKGHLVYVITDGKGKNGVYEYEVIKLSSTNQQYNKDMRYYMKENGMPPRMALAAFSGQWDELNRMILGGFALALSSGRMPGKNPSGAMSDLESSMIARWRSTQRVSSRPNAPAKPHVAEVPPAPPKPVTKPKVDANAPTLPHQQPARPASPKPAVEPKFDPNGPTVKTKNGATVKTNGETVKTEAPAPGKKKAARPLFPPDNQMTEIKTPRGAERITVGELRRRMSEAFKWMTDQSRKLSLETEKTPGGYRSPASFWKQLSGEAQRRFNLPPGWELL